MSCSERLIINIAKHILKIAFHLTLQCVSMVVHLKWLAICFLTEGKCNLLGTEALKDWVPAGCPPWAKSGWMCGCWMNHATATKETYILSCETDEFDWKCTSEWRLAFTRGCFFFSPLCLFSSSTSETYVFTDVPLSSHQLTASLGFVCFPGQIS